ncbi:MAG: carbonic anhydrase [Myxococcales bacterium]|nr:carbonic anhydrase [Myxococcales bacterium]
MAKDLYQRIFENNRAWVREYLEDDPDYFNRLAQGQNPEFLFIGCSDSRVPLTDVMGLEPGSAFIHRNVANVVPNTDMNAHSVIQYAVDVLEVDYIVVCGHYGCGGVEAAMRSEDRGLLNGWLREVRDVYRLHADTLDAIESPTERYRRLVELNVQEQAINIAKTSWVQKHWLRRGAPTVHGWVFDIASGELNDLNLPFEEIMEKIRGVYRLDV